MKSGRILNDWSNKVSSNGVSMRPSSSAAAASASCKCGRHQAPAPLVIEDVEIPVWVNGTCEKWLTGLTKRTTCDDVIYALLSQESLSDHNVANYAIFEQWRGVRRPLKGRTKIIKVWRTWGSESRNVKLTMCQMEQSLDTSSEASKVVHHHRRRYSKERDIKRDKSSHRKDDRHGRSHREKTREYSNHNETKKHRSDMRLSSPLDKHEYSSPIRSADRYTNSSSRVASPSVYNGLHREDIEASELKVTSSNVFSKPTTGRRTPSVDSHDSAQFQELLHVIKKQEALIAQQLERLHEADNQIASCEKRSQEKKSQATNDVLTNKDSLFPNIKANDIEAYLHICDSILQIQERIENEQAKIELLSSSVNDDQKFVPKSMSNDYGHPSQNFSQQIQEEMESIRNDIQRSINLSAAQQKQLHLVSDTLNECEKQLRLKRHYLEHLSRQSETIDREASAADHTGSSSGIESGIENSPEPYQMPSVLKNKYFVTADYLRSSSPSARQCPGQLQGGQEDFVRISESPDYCHVEMTPRKSSSSSAKDSSDADSEKKSHHETNVKQTKTEKTSLKKLTSSLKGILKTKTQGYSVRFADEASHADYVNFNPSLTEVFEYSKYEGHNYVNIDDLDLGYDEGIEEWTENKDPESAKQRVEVYNVDTGELYFDNADHKLDCSMVPYRTYQFRSDCDVPSKASSSDDNSDTGLSSMHSDDPLPPTLETLV